MDDPRYACPSCLASFMRWSACESHMWNACRNLTEENYNKMHLLSRECVVNGKAQNQQIPRKSSFSKRGVPLKKSKPTKPSDPEQDLQAIKENLERAIFSRRKSYICQSCCMSECNTLFVPCGHSIACRSCLVVMKTSNCPVCNEIIEDLQII
jgi:Zinc finger, C3HC4 type (RING finger)